MYLQELHNRNETLYHRVLAANITEIAPLVYTPTVGLVCQKFGEQFRRSRGMYFSREDKGLFSSMVWNWPHDDVHVICVTDGSRILGQATSARTAWASRSESSPYTARRAALHRIV